MNRMKKWAAPILALMILTAGLLILLPSKHKPQCSVRWDDSVHGGLLLQATKDFENAKGCRVLSIDLISPGGSIAAGIELIRQIERAKAQGMIVELHGGGHVASMATVILASGSLGHRYVYEYALVGIHGVQYGGECTYPKPPFVNEQDRMLNASAETLAALLSKYTGHPLEVTQSWLTCGNEQYGNGQLLLKLGFVDHIE